MNWLQRLAVGLLAVGGGAACSGGGFSSNEGEQSGDAGRPASAGATTERPDSGSSEAVSGDERECERDRDCEGDSICSDDGECVISEDQQRAEDDASASDPQPTKPDIGDVTDDGPVPDIDAASESGCANDLECPEDQVCNRKTESCVGCLDTSDCAAGQTCKDSECVVEERCVDSLECSGASVCDASTGICVDCLTDEDCLDSEECVEQQCRLQCLSNEACADQNMVCDMALGSCVLCLTDDDCDADFHCALSNECVPDECSSGSSECRANAVYQCDGRDFTLLRACGDGQTCVETADQARCVDWLCTPGSVDCAEGVLETCSGDGMTLDRVDCELTGQYCAQGACVSTICEPGAVRCEGTVRYLCAPDGLSETATSCAQQEVCDPAVGQCILQLCTPNAPVCAENVATTCNALGTGYVAEQTSCPVACSQGACSDALFFEDFEDGDLDGWLSRGGASTMSVTSATAAAGTTYSARIDRNSNHHQGYYHLLPDIRPTYISFWARSETTDLADTYFCLRQSNDADVLSIYFDNDEGGTFHASNGTTHWTVGSYVPNVWYHFEFTIDWDDKTYDLDVDGVRLGTGFGFQSSASSIGQLDLYNYRDGVGHWDEILMR